MPRTHAKPASRLSTEAITDATLRLITERGVEAVTMRALAARCDISVATLYARFGTKDELLASVVDKLLADIPFPDQRLPWDQRITELTRALYQTYAAHPELASITAAQTVPGQAAANILRFALQAFAEAGLDDQEILVAHDSLTAYLIGSILRESSPGAKRPGIADILADVRANGPAFGQPDPDAPDPRTSQRFEAGLAMLLRGIANTPTNPA